MGGFSKFGSLFNENAERVLKENKINSKLVVSFKQVLRNFFSLKSYRQQKSAFEIKNKRERMPKAVKKSKNYSHTHA